MSLVDADELAAFAAIAGPTGAEDARLGWLEHRLRALPGDRRRDECGNLVWRFGPNPPRLLLLVHVDTVFDESVDLKIRRRGDDLIGPGVGDNAAAVMATVWGLEAMAPTIPTGLAVTFTVGEEGLGNLRGALHTCAELRPATAIALEGHGLETVIVDHVGSVRASIEVTGPGGHSWWDRGTPSATHALVSVAQELAAAGANIGIISGGLAVNAIAAGAQMIVERRSLDQAELDAFAIGLDRVTVDPPLRVQCTIRGRRAAGGVPHDHAVVATVKAARAAIGVPTEMGSGSTDANAAAAFGIPAIALGCAHGFTMHTPDERISISSLERGCLMVSGVIDAVAAERGARA
jgi:tripeptide aminopeptidase